MGCACREARPRHCQQARSVQPACRLRLTETCSRPDVSNDDPYFQAVNKSPAAFPARFRQIEHARTFCSAILDWSTARTRVLLDTPASTMAPLSRSEPNGPPPPRPTTSPTPASCPSRPTQAPRRRPDHTSVDPQRRAEETLKTCLRILDSLGNAMPANYRVQLIFRGSELEYS